MPLLAAEEKSSATIAWAEKNESIKCERGHLLSWEDFWRHSGTLGRSEEEQRQFYSDNPIVQMNYQGRKLYAGASHFQFVAKTQVLQQFFPLSADRPMGQVRQLDDAINQAGYLRLSTAEWHIQHIGNALPEDLSELGIESVLETAPVQKNLPRTIWDFEKVQNILYWLHTKTFEKLYRRK